MGPLPPPAARKAPVVQRQECREETDDAQAVTPQLAVSAAVLNDAWKQLEQATLAAQAYVDAIATWQASGWSAFLEKTGGNGFIALTDAEWRALTMSRVSPPPEIGVRLDGDQGPGLRRR